jgi:hypothetical protein
MLEKCMVKVLSNKVVCDNAVDVKKEEQVRHAESVKNKRKYTHLEGIGMDLTKYHPTIIRTMVDGGRDFKIPEQLRNQLVLFANEAHEKGFNPSLFGYNTTLHKFIKEVHNIPKRKYVMKGGAKTRAKPVESSSESESSSSESESETDLDAVLSDVERDVKGGRIGEVKKTLKRYKHRIPPSYYNGIMKSISK